MMNLEEHTLTSSCSEYTRRVWYLPAEDPPVRIGIFLDGEYYVNQMDAPAQLVALQREGVIAPMVCLFVSHVHNVARHNDYICNERYARFITNDLITWIQNRNKGLTAHDCLIGGLSLSGLQAAYTALVAPEIFSTTLCQSGSLWWNQEWLKDDLQNRSRIQGKFWISVGNRETESGISHPPTELFQEVDQITAVERFADALESQGGTVYYHLFEGRHDTKCWEAELSYALEWLLL